MPTRRVKDGEARTQNGWASAVEFDGLRGLNGTAVSMKAELIEEERAKNLLYFLQAASLKSGGLNWIAREVDASADEIERICCNPSVLVTPGNDDATSRYRAQVLRMCEDSGSWDASHFEGGGKLVGELLEFQKRYTAKVRDSFVKTSIGEVVFEALDYALETGRSALIEGNSGIGKTTALEAWCEMHADRARLVKLKGITHRTGFFRECARALGVAQGVGLSPGKIQMRVEQFLQRTKIMLVIDEGQYLFPPGNRVYSPPELINWLMTACYNERVPFAISATAEFKKRRAIIEKNTTWDSFQLRRRIRRDFELPELPTKDDLFAVATKLLPGQSQSAIDYVVGYSLASKGFFQAITDAIDDARLIARRDGRDKITFADLKCAIRDWRSPSDNALQRVFEPLKTRRGRPPLTIQAEEPQPNLSADRTVLNADLRPDKTALRQQFSLVEK